MMRAQSAEGRAPRPIRSSALRALCSALSFNRDRIAIGLIVLLFLSIRVPLLIVREPFFDELATVVFARAPISELWAMLQQDSASPLYLGFSRLIESIGAFTVRSGRLLSLAFASLTLLGLLTYRAHRARQAALIGAALLAVFLPHAYFSTEARAYALAALLIGIATLALYRFLESRRTTWLAIATASAVLAAYSHAYGVLLFPSLAVFSFCTRDHRIVAKGIMASLAAAVLFIPGFLLARSQPVDSIAWMDPGSFSERVSLVLGTIQQFGFAAPFPTLFGPPLIPWLRIVSMIVVGAIAVWGLWKSTDARFFGLMLLIPIIGVFAFALTGRMFYFPGRFESVWSVPFVMLLGSGLVAFPQRARPFLVATLVGLGTAVCSIAIADHVNRQPDPFRRVSQLVRRNVDPGTTIVASGYMYLELLSQTDARWRPRIIAFPAEQAHHPGWAAKPSPDQLQLEIPWLPDQILWVGLRDTPEEKIIGENFNLRLMTAEGPVVASLGAK